MLVTTHANGAAIRKAVIKNTIANSFIAKDQIVIAE